MKTFLTRLAAVVFLAVLAPTTLGASSPVSPEDAPYNAVGDGVADDYSALQAGERQE